MPKKLNIANLVPDALELETGDQPWGKLIRCDDCMISSFAAHAALRELASSWSDDHGQNRQFVLSTLDITIRLLKSWRATFAAVVVTEDALDSETERLAAIMAERRVHPVELTAISNTMDVANKRREGSGFDDAAIDALVTSAFAPPKEQA